MYLSNNGREEILVDLHKVGKSNDDGVRVAAPDGRHARLAESRHILRDFRDDVSKRGSDLDEDDRRVELRETLM